MRLILFMGFLPKLSNLDFSMQSDFQDFAVYENKIKQTLDKTFNEEGYKIIDFKFKKKPQICGEDLMEFWGGYSIDFKVIDKQTYFTIRVIFQNCVYSQMILIRNTKKILQLILVNLNIVQARNLDYVDGLKIYVYSPEMIIFEKIKLFVSKQKNT